MLEEEEFLTVCKDYISGIDNAVVAYRLHYDLLVDLNLGRFALDEDMGLGEVINNDNISPLVLSVDIYGILLRDTQCRNAFARDKPRDNMLAYPLLGSE